MQSDVNNLYQQSLDTSHYGHPTVLSNIYSGGRGRPRIHIDPSFLGFAYNRRSISALARFLGVGRSTVRNELVRNNLMPVSISTISPSSQNGNLEASIPESLDSDASLPLEPDDLLEPELPVPTHIPVDLDTATTVPRTSLHHSAISDDELDMLIIRLRRHYTRAGIRMLDGMLRRLGHRIQYDRIRQSLLRIDPVRRIFERIRIRRRTYRVAGPNALWHHDGQHGKSILSTSIPSRLLTC